MMEDFSGLALPPLFGGHILEAELEPGGVELLDSTSQVTCPGQDDEDEEDEEAEEQRRELEKRKYIALSKRCRELEQVNERILGRMHQVQRLTRRLKKERRFLMKTLDSYGDDYRSAHLAIILEDEAGSHIESNMRGEDERHNGLCTPSPSVHHTSAMGTKKKRHRAPKERERETPQPEGELPEFSGFPNPNAASHLPNANSTSAL